MNSEIRVRFAPSPTGSLHIGGARTALFNWLFARHHGGKLILRVEDTDQARNTKAAAAAIYEGLEWLGLNWDEGPHVGGDFGPYFQSERTPLYERYLKKLHDGGHIFEDQGALRFRSPREHVVVDDLVAGKIDFDLSNEQTHPDMTIRRPDGSWIFHFVNVIDDLEMKISHVVRGEDHLSNTAKHIELIRALGATPPQYAHIPLILNKNGSKMSKRDEGASVGYYLKKGYLPAAVRNYLCLLGWSPKDDREKIDLDEIVKIFELKNVGHSNATFDPAKLHWLNGEYMRSIDDDEYYQVGKRRLLKEGVPIGFFKPPYVQEVILSSRNKIKTFAELAGYVATELRTEGRLELLSDLPGHVALMPEDDFAYDPVGVAKYFSRETKSRLVALRDVFAQLSEFTAENLEQALKSVAADLNLKPAALVHPTRLAISGKLVGRGLYQMLEARGKDRVIGLIDRAVREINRRPVIFKRD